MLIQSLKLVNCLVSVIIGLIYLEQEGDTALMEASRNGYEEAVGFLLEMGADINKQHTVQLFVVDDMDEPC
jgi:ankyrin repeat protein